MEPSAGELGGLTTVAAVCNWVKMDEELQKALFEHMGIAGDGPPRHLATIEESDVTDAKNTIKLRAAALKPGLKAMVGEAWRIAKLAARMTKTQEAIDKEAADMAKFEAEKLVVLKAQAEAKTAEAAVKSKIAVDTSDNDSVKLSEVIDQLSTLVAPMMTLTAINAAHNHYTVKMDGAVTKDERCTDQQLSCLRFLFQKGHNPNVDLAIFGPYQNRLRRKLILSGLVLGADGTYQRVEFKGPPDINVWHAGFLTYKSGLISLDITGVNPIERYVKKVFKFHRDYGTVTWHLLYQAETRMRSEEFPCIRRELIAQKEAVEEAGGKHPFDPADPWKSVWAMATHKDYEHFWTEEFVTPAMMVRLHLKKIGDVVDGDAPIDDVRLPGAKTTAAASSTPGVVVDDVPTPPPPQRGATRKAEDGTYLTTRKTGKKLCPWYAEDRCDPAHQGTTICPWDSGARHQCTKCLKPHPACYCDGYGNVTWPEGKGGKGKEKGKPKRKKGGGKGDKGGWKKQWWQK